MTTRSKTTERKEEFPVGGWNSDHRTETYRDISTICSKIYMMHNISSHYKFSPEKIAPRKIMAGISVPANVTEEFANVKSKLNRRVQSNEPRNANQFLRLESRRVP